MTTDVADAKRALRAELAALLRPDDPALALAPLRTALEGDLQLVTAFVSIPGEPDTTELRRELASSGTAVALPVLLEDDALTWALEASDASSWELSPGRRGTSHPTGPPVRLSDVDLMLVPAVAVDRSGGRLGRGGGSYDRSIAEYRRVREDGLVVACVSTDRIVTHVPMDLHDERVDAILTAEACELLR